VLRQDAASISIAEDEQIAGHILRGVDGVFEGASDDSGTYMTETRNSMRERRTRKGRPERFGHQQRLEQDVQESRAKDRSPCALDGRIART
jgi:hypothetical protein